jgi:heparan-alpha-glucosaminide N-acetyltransferase
MGPSFSQRMPAQEPAVKTSAPHVPNRERPRDSVLDALRGLDVLLMLFVNEVAGVPGAPSFLRHKTRDVDGMTLTDGVFPAFLFIVGMAVPLALGARLRRDGRRGAFLHVLQRAAALLLLGVLMVNAEEQVGAVHGLPPEFWNVLMTLGALLAFWVRPSARRTWDGPRLAGVALLVASFLLYRTDGGVGFIQIRTQWWGILGLIGWAYLVAGSLYLVAGDELGVHIGALGVLCALCLADEAGNLAWLAAVRPYLEVGRLVASHAAIAVAGVGFAILGSRARNAEAPGRGVLRAGILYAAPLLAAAALVHSLHGLDPAFWVNKIRATVPWCLFSAGGTCLVWTALSALEGAGVSRWPRVVRIAGENPLLAYLLAPLALSVFQVAADLASVPNPYEALRSPLSVGLLRSAVFAWAIVVSSGFLRGKGLRLQL